MFAIKITVILKYMRMSAGYWYKIGKTARALFRERSTANVDPDWPLDDQSLGILVTPRDGKSPNCFDEFQGERASMVQTRRIA